MTEDDLFGVREEAATGFSLAATDYAAARPNYPAAVVPWLEDDLGLSAGSVAVDLGAGTGKFTQFLVRTNARVFAVEPVDTMRQELEHFLPEVEVHRGSATAIPLPDGSVDAVLCAQCFHWFATEEALQEISRVLKPQGTLGLVWNHRDASVPWAYELEELLKAYEREETPQYHKGWWRRLFPGSAFGPLQEQEVSYVHRGDPATIILKRSFSVSYISLLPDDEKLKLRRRIEDLINGAPELKGKSEVGYPYKTLMARAQKV